jgi:hypothetical protein
MKPRILFFEAILLISGMLVGVSVPLLPTRDQQLAASILAALLVATAVIWYAYEKGGKSLALKTFGVICFVVVIASFGFIAGRNSVTAVVSTTTATATAVPPTTTITATTAPPTATATAVPPTATITATTAPPTATATAVPPTMNPTSEPSPTTSNPKIILDMNSAWENNGVFIALRTNRNGNDPNSLIIMFTVTNTSSSDVAVTLNPGMVSLEDISGNPIEVEPVNLHYAGTSACKPHRILLQAGASLATEGGRYDWEGNTGACEYVVRADLAQVNEMIVTIRGITNDIPEARWRFRPNVR